MTIERAKIYPNSAIVCWSVDTTLLYSAEVCVYCSFCGLLQCIRMILKLDPNELLPIRVQYLADTDPYNSMAMYPVPSRAPTYSFACSTPLATQLGAILRLLGAPHRVSWNSLTINIYLLLSEWPPIAYLRVFISLSILFLFISRENWLSSTMSLRTFPTTNS